MINKQNQIKKKIRNIIFQELTHKDILSVTFVRSFIGKKKLSEINDIDLIIIVKDLKKKNFNEIKKKIQKIQIKKYFHDKNKILINHTFGPLKFNTKNKLVIHLMVYDIKGHIEHIIKSPFTVFDWERSSFYKYRKMSDFSSVGFLQLNDFINSRRSINRYISDLNKKSISYRVYKFSNNNYSLITKFHKINDKDKIVFYFHIVKNLIMNFIKYRNKDNKVLNEKNIDREVIKNFDKIFYLKHIKNIKKLINYKNKSILKNLNIFDIWIKIFLKDFQKKIKEELSVSKKITFIRHLKTDLNDNTFLGQKRNPSILKKLKDQKIKIKFEIIYTSPLKRCLDTLKKLMISNKIILDKNLKEINYGKVDGLTFEELKKNYPRIIDQWNKKKDPRFPSGENINDMLRRQKIFIKKLKQTNKNKIGIVTHNIFLRCLIGSTFNISKEKWFKIKIPHGKKLEFLMNNKKLYPNIDRKLLNQLIQNI